MVEHIAIWVGLGVVWAVPAWKFHFGPSLRGDFAHAPTCYCPECPNKKES